MLSRLDKPDKVWVKNGMRLPNEAEIGSGLRRWRDLHGWSAKHVAQESKRRGKQEFSEGRVNKWEKGRTSFTYKQLEESILPAYRIDDFDIFVDFCRPPSLDDVTEIDAKSFTASPIALDGAIDQYLNKGFLKAHRTRIDKVTFRQGKGQTTPWGAHDGHEFVLVLQGSVNCEFAVTADGPRKSYTISEGGAIAFPSALFHKFSNASDSEPAVLVAARPSHSGIAANKTSEG